MQWHLKDYNVCHMFIMLKDVHHLRCLTVLLKYNKNQLNFSVPTPHAVHVAISSVTSTTFDAVHHCWLLPWPLLLALWSETRPLSARRRWPVTVTILCANRVHMCFVAVLVLGMKTMPNNGASMPETGPQKANFAGSESESESESEVGTFR